MFIFAHELLLAATVREDGAVFYRYNIGTNI